MKHSDSLHTWILPDWEEILWGTHACTQTKVAGITSYLPLSNFGTFNELQG